MKKLLALSAGLALYAAIQLTMSCADPLDNGGLSPSPITQPSTDTLVIFDTTVIIDSVFIFDTVTRIDTIIITNPHGDDSLAFCSKLGEGDHKIVWMLQNDEGDYHLEFEAYAERGKPEQTLIVSIGDDTFTWSPADNSSYTSDRHLSVDTRIKIALSEPCAYGHEIHVCLKLSKVN